MAAGDTAAGDMAGANDRGLARRDLFKLGGVAAGGLAMAGTAAACAPPGAGPTDPLDFIFPPDQRRRIVLKAPRNPDQPTMLEPAGSSSVLVIGGGVAGLSAALELAERGFTVTVREAGDVFGGRLATRSLDPGFGQEFRVEHGLHMWFDNYRTFEDILHRLGTTEMFRAYDVVNFVFRNRLPEALESTPKVFPFNLMGIVERSPNLNNFDLLGALGILPDVFRFRFDGLFDRWDDTTFYDWIRERNVADGFREVIFEPAAHVTLNKPESLSAAEMLLYQHLYFTSQPFAFDRTIPTVDHGLAVIDPWVEKLRGLGATLSTTSPVQGLEVSGDRVTGLVGESGGFDWVVLATDVPGARSVLAGSTSDAAGTGALGAVTDSVGRMEVATPYRMLRVWFDRQPDSSRPDVIETPQHEGFSLICLYHLLEEESIAWADATGGSILEFHCYDVHGDLATATDEELWNVIEPTVLEVLPEMAGAQVLGQTVGNYENFTSFATGQGSARPFPQTPQDLGISNLLLAGDWVAAPVPSALMERSVLTGRLAANECLVSEGVREVGYSHVSPLGPAL